MSALQKNERILNLVKSGLFTVFGLLTAIGPQTIFHVCPRDPEKMTMSCYYTASAEIGVGAIIAVLGIIYAIVSDRKFRLGLSTAQIFNSVFALLIPTVLIGVCKGEHMHCHSVTLPALIILSIAVFITALADIIVYFIKRNKGASNGE